MLGRAGTRPDALALAEQSDAFGPLVACVREAEARGLDIDGALPRLVGARGFADTGDVAARLHGRIERWAAAARPMGPAPGFVAGIVPRVSDLEDADMARALIERDAALCRRARELAGAALRRQEPWLRVLGSPPGEPEASGMVAGGGRERRRVSRALRRARPGTSAQSRGRGGIG
jgi:hypothetical protein